MARKNCAHEFYACECGNVACDKCGGVWGQFALQDHHDFHPMLTPERVKKAYLDVQRSFAPDNPIVATHGFDGHGDPAILAPDPPVHQGVHQKAGLSWPVRDALGVPYDFQPD